MEKIEAKVTLFWIIMPLGSIFTFRKPRSIYPQILQLHSLTHSLTQVSWTGAIILYTLPWDIRLNRCSVPPGLVRCGLDIDPVGIIPRRRRTLVLSSMNLHPR